VETIIIMMMFINIVMVSLFLPLWL